MSCTIMERGAASPTTNDLAKVHLIAFIIYQNLFIVILFFLNLFF